MPGGYDFLYEDHPTFQEGGQSGGPLPDDPTQAPGFEINAVDSHISFVPEFYPNRFPQKKGKEISRDGSSCKGETVSIDKVKNRDFHVQGFLIEAEIPVFKSLQDHEGAVEIISPLTKFGGVECIIEESELGDMEGYDPHKEQWIFNYSLDLVSTGKDEHGSERNAIVSEITEPDPEP